jgi:hypothetical protein
MNILKSNERTMEMETSCKFRGKTGDGSFRTVRIWIHEVSPQRLSSADASTAIILQVYNNLCARSCTLELAYAFALSPTRRMVLFVRIGLKPQGALPVLFRRPWRVEV